VQPTVIVVPFLVATTSGARLQLLEFEPIDQGFFSEASFKVVVEEDSGRAFGEAKLASLVNKAVESGLVSASLEEMVVSQRWRVKRRRRVRCVRTVMTSKDTGEMNHAQTFLFVEPLVEGDGPFR
jgi:hypothetical protein